jgi:hypothetical protein
LTLLGNVIIEPGATFSGNGLLENVGVSSLTLADGADVGVRLVNHGTMTIGSSPGTATVDDLIQTQGTWIVEIGGTAAGTQFDQLVVTNGASISGTLEVELIDLGAGLFAPSLGDIFEILVANSVVGEFDQLSLPDLSAGLFWQVISQPDVVLLAVADHIAGDYNRNGVVDAADYVVWRKAEGSATNLAADGNLDGTVDDLDYSIWRANFGAIAASSLAAASRVPHRLAAVPEPTSAALAVLAVFVACHGSRRYHKRGQLASS